MKYATPPCGILLAAYARPFLKKPHGTGATPLPIPIRPRALAFNSIAHSWCRPELHETVGDLKNPM